MWELIKKPSAWMPIVMATLIFIAGFFEYLDHGFTPQEDEGVGAHLFQLFTPLEILIIIYFILKYFSVNRASSIKIFVLQMIMWFLPIALVFSLGL